VGTVNKSERRDEVVGDTELGVVSFTDPPSVTVVCTPESVEFIPSSESVADEAVEEFAVHWFIRTLEMQIIATKTDRRSILYIF